MSIYQEIVKTIAKISKMVIWRKEVNYHLFVRLVRLMVAVKILLKERSWNLSIKTIFMPSPKVAIMF